MRVLWASHSAQIGGAELCLLEGATALHDRGVEVHVVVPNSGPLVGRLGAAGADISTVPYVPWLQPRSSVAGRVRRTVSHTRSAWELAAVVRDVGPDVVVTNTVTIPAAAMAARLAGVAHVWYIHEYGDLDHGFVFDYGLRATTRVIDALSDRVVVNSTAVEDHFSRYITRTPIDKVYYAVDLPAAAVPVGGPVAGSPAGGRSPFEVVLVGTRQPGKRQEDAVRALGLLRAAGVDAALTLVGPADPGYDAALRRLAAEGGVADRVRFVGRVDDPGAYVAGADVALMCSVREAFGRVTVEAMKLGVPVVGAASGGTLDVVRDGETGLLYRPGDASDLAAKLSVLHGDPGRRSRMGRAARADAGGRFTMGAYGRDLAEAFGRAAAAS